MTKKRYLLLVLFPLFLGCTRKDNDKTINSIIIHDGVIHHICAQIKFSERKYVSCIYGELYNNYNEFDKLDIFRAKLGYDPSVGFSQIKISTFYWIEDNSNNPLITKSLTKKELLSKITTDSINILYSVTYIKMINNLFVKKYSKDASVKSLGSFYSAGIDYGKDDVDTNYFNIVGETAEKFYYSNMLINEYPR